jgi:hypothetical protein
MEEDVFQVEEMALAKTEKQEVMCSMSLRGSIFQNPPVGRPVGRYITVRRFFRTLWGEVKWGGRH